ncbi:MAG: AraC family transcriptional regulator [Calditrichaeota bacterium]|nr:MAG: AraC family transcriptional regulator [Calditrichota bacterium]
MIYLDKQPSEKLSRFIKEFWMIDSQGSSKINREKIIPDGYPEMIFHYKSPLIAIIKGEKIIQEKFLIAGQIKDHFFLENQGEYGMFGIKLQPYTLRNLLGIDMSDYTDKVLTITDEQMKNLNSLKEVAVGSQAFDDKIADIEKILITLLDCDSEPHPGELAVQIIIEHNGLVTIEQLLDKVSLNERALERYFKTYVGLSPKFFCRIIRFASIFRLVTQDKIDWADVSYRAGFYDQSHFIKNFKEFTGEEPSVYGFNKKNMANFFLKKE